MWGSPGMVALKRRHCQFPLCTHAPYGRGSLCITHGAERRVCASPGCTRWRLSKSRPFCTRHGGIPKVRTCGAPGCQRWPMGPGGVCVAHGGGFECSRCGLRYSSLVQTLCWYCRGGVPRKSKERRVLCALEERLPWEIIYKDEPVSGVLCSAYRPDAVILLEDRVIVIEIDENAHAMYPRSCEATRMVTLAGEWPGRTTIFIRYNPDGCGHKYLGCRWSFTVRMNVLLETLEKWSKRVLVGTHAVYLFYPSTLELPESPHLKNHRVDVSQSQCLS